MKLGVRAHDFGRMEANALAGTIAKLGFETAQLALIKAIAGINRITDVNFSMLEPIRRVFEDNRVEIGVLGCYVEIGYTDRDARLNEVEKFLLGLEHAKELGVNLVGTETTYFSPAPDAKPLREAAYQNLKDSILRMVERAEKLNVNIGIETVADHTLNTAELTRRLLDEVKSTRLKVIFDPVNLILTDHDMQSQEKIYKNFLEAVGTDISALHVKDITLVNGEKIWHNIGKGGIRYGTIAEWLQKNNLNIPILREHIKPESSDIDLEALQGVFTE